MTRIQNSGNSTHHPDPPVGQLVVVLVAGAIVGVLAGLRPARRAARLDVLQAIGAE